MAKVKRFAMVAYSGGPMRLAGFKNPVAVNLASMKPVRKQGPILKNHDPAQIVGHWDAAGVAKQIMLTGVISGIGDAAQEIAATAAEGFPWRASIGAQADKMRFVDEGKFENVNGQQLAGPLYIAEGAILGEASIVALPADVWTDVTISSESYDSEPARASADGLDIQASAVPNLFAIPFEAFDDGKGNVRPWGRFKNVDAVESYASSIKAMCQTAEIQARAVRSYPAVPTIAAGGGHVAPPVEDGVRFLSLANTGDFMFPGLGYNTVERSAVPTIYALDSLVIPSQPIPVMYNHAGGAIGKATRLWVNQFGVWASGILNRVAAERFRGREKWGASLTCSGPPDGVLGIGKVNGRDLSSCGYAVFHVIRGAQPIELTVCDCGADRDAYFMLDVAA